MAQKPTPTPVKLGTSHLFIPQRCGNCKFFKRMAHPAYEKACSVLDVLAEAKPCERFTPDARKLKFAKPRHASMVTALLREIGTADLKTLASLAMQETQTRKNGFFFGDYVYLRAFGDDFISNYRRAVVVGADDLYVHIEADAGFAAMIYHDSVLTAQQWRTKKKWLEDRERLQDPRYARYIPNAEQAKLQAARIRNTLDALDLDITNGGPLTEGARPEKRRSLRETELTDLIVERRPSTPLPKSIRVI